MNLIKVIRTRVHGFYIMPNKIKVLIIFSYIYEIFIYWTTVIAGHISPGINAIINVLTISALCKALFPCNIL